MEGRYNTTKEKLATQKKELATKQRQFETFELLEGKMPGPKVYECPMCKGKCFTSKSYLKSHVKRRHQNDVNLVKTQPEKLPEPSIPASLYNQEFEEINQMKSKLDAMINKMATVNLAKQNDFAISSDEEIYNLKRTINDLKEQQQQMQNMMYSTQKNQQLDEHKIRSFTGMEERKHYESKYMHRTTLEKIPESNESNSYVNYPIFRLTPICLIQK